MKIEYQVVDSGPATVEQPWRRIEFRVKGSAVSRNYAQRMSPLEVEHVRDDRGFFLTWWNDGFVLEAFKTFYAMLAAEQAGWITAPEEAK